MADDNANRSGDLGESLASLTRAAEGAERHIALAEDALHFYLLRLEHHAKQGGRIVRSRPLVPSRNELSHKGWGRALVSWLLSWRRR